MFGKGATGKGKRQQSEAWFERAKKVTPGGVNSPVRAFGSVGGTPLVIRSALGSVVVDSDGREYLDFVGSWGPLILGHAHAKIVAAVEAACRRGTSYGAPCTPEIELAEEVVAAYHGVDQVRFVSSGTEAVMSAIRVARAFTGRDLIVKYAGCYHGHADHLLVSAGSGLATFGKPSSAGVPAAFVFGAIAAKVGAKPAILGSLVLYTVTSVLAFRMTTARDFMVLAALVGLVQGGSQALSRSVFASLIPKDRTAEFFGFFSVFEKFAGIFGPLLFSAAVALTHSNRAAILSVILFFVAGGALLITVDVGAGRRAVER